MPGTVDPTIRRPGRACAPSAGLTLWLTGLPSAGKSTIARELAGRLRSVGRLVEVLDGDEMRANVTKDLGFSEQDRNENVRRIGWLAHLLARNGVAVLAPAIAPYASARLAVRRLHENTGVPYIEVHVSTALHVCAARDVKGLYASQARGELIGLTGIDDPYEVPVDPDLRIDTDGRPVTESAAEVYDLLAQRGLACPRRSRLPGHPRRSTKP